MKLNKDLDPTKIQQMSQKPNKNPTNETKTQQKSNNPSKKTQQKSNKKTQHWRSLLGVGVFKKPNKKPNILFDLLDFSWVFFVGLPTPDLRRWRHSRRLKFQKYHFLTTAAFLILISNISIWYIRMTALASSRRASGFHASKNSSFTNVRNVDICAKNTKCPWFVKFAHFHKWVFQGLLC